MELIKILLKIIFKIALTLFLVSMVWWLVALLFPNLSYKSILPKGGIGNLLPEPGSLKFLSREASAPKEYVHGDPFNGYGDVVSPSFYSSTTQFISYGNTQNQKVYVNPKVSPPENLSIKGSPYLRNLSIYENGNLYNGLTFSGEVSSSMLKNGQFPIIIFDNNKGVAIGVIPGVQVSGIGSDGWAKFQSKININFSNKTPCTMIFQSGDYQSAKVPIRVMFPVVCG